MKKNPTKTAKNKTTKKLLAIMGVMIDQNIASADCESVLSIDLVTLPPTEAFFQVQRGMVMAHI